MAHRIHVRTAGTDDLHAVLRFAAMVPEIPAARRLIGRPPAAETVTSSHRERYRRLLADPERHVLLAVGEDGEALGMGVVAADRTGHLLDIPAARLTHLVVDRRHRRKGVGRAVIAAAVAFAERYDIDHVMVGVSPASREGNRFLARLGFMPVLVRRVATVQVLRRHLVVPDVGLDLPSAPPRRRRRRPLPRGREGVA
ncbi:MAG TPA: GNAT family N-acetyltransferase [Mycobacteriales bacterium]|jgi:GNAT superfamily N-acetyltransferase|nr:GNAT family N-acetyltransferase [Mycobacteriales bacterium]